MADDSASETPAKRIKLDIKETENGLHI